MCIYIKDDGETCSRDEEPFCFQHEGSGQAAIYQQALQAAESISDGGGQIHDPYHCQDCETAVRRTVDEIEQSDYSPEMVNVTEKLACTCSEAEVRTYRMEKAFIPDGWKDE